ncbi:hypothetical protein FI667_g16473, partial [Globisporangium splendens]
MAPGWSATETKALLCAWHEEAALSAPVLRSTIRSSDQLSEMYMRFVALCDGHTLRTQVSMHMRRNALKNMWRIITKYNSQHKHEGDSNDSSGNGTRNSSTGWTTQGWFALQEWEKQVWFTKADVKSYKLVDIDQHTFHAIDGIMKIAAHQKEKGRERRLQCRQQVEGASSLSVVSQETAQDEEATKEQHDKMSEHLPDDSADFDSDSGGSTESDEEVIAVVGGVTSEALTVPADFVPPPSRKKNREPEIAQSTDDGWHPIITKKQKLPQPIHAAQKPISSPPELNQSPAQKQRMARSKLVFLGEPSPLVQTPAVNAAKSSTSGGITVSSGVTSNAHHATEQQPKSAVTQSKADQRPASDASPTQLVQALNERKSDTTETQSRFHMFNRPRSQKESVCPASDQQEQPKTTPSAITWDALTFGSIQSTTSHAQRVRKRWKQWDDPDRLELLDRLQKWIDKLKSIFRDVSAHQKVTQDERNELLEQIRLDKEEKRLALEEIRCREVNIQQELNEWRLEKEEFKREWRRMCANHQRSPEHCGDNYGL